MSVITPVLFFILFMIAVIYSSKSINLSFVSDHTVELIWSILPIVMLFVIGIFSLGSMYTFFNNSNLLNSVEHYNNEIKVTGMQ